MAFPAFCLLPVHGISRSTISASSMVPAIVVLPAENEARKHIAVTVLTSFVPIHVTGAGNPACYGAEIDGAIDFRLVQAIRSQARPSGYRSAAAS